MELTDTYEQFLNCGEFYVCCRVIALGLSEYCSNAKDGKVEAYSEPVKFNRTVSNYDGFKTVTSGYYGQFVDNIIISGNIVIKEDFTLSPEHDLTITRDKSYKGTLFNIGGTTDGYYLAHNGSVTFPENTSINVTFGSDTHKIIIDGNSGNVEAQSPLMVVYAGNVEINNVTFQNADSSKYSGALAVMGDTQPGTGGDAIDPKLRVKNTSFINNRNTCDDFSSQNTVLGAGAFQNDACGNVILENCVFNNNYSKFGGYDVELNGNIYTGTNGTPDTMFINTQLNSTDTNGEGNLIVNNPSHNWGTLEGKIPVIIKDNPAKQATKLGNIINISDNNSNKSPLLFIFPEELSGSPKLGSILSEDTFIDAVCVPSEENYHEYFTLKTGKTYTLSENQISYSSEYFDLDAKTYQVYEIK